MQQNTNFSIDASLVDLNSQQVGNFNRSTMVHLEREIDGAAQLYPIEAYAPAIYSEDSAFLLEPEGINYVTWNMNLTQSVYVKGSNVVIQPDEIKAPDSSYLADRIIWAPSTGDPNAQILRRSLTLEAETVHTLSAILRLEGGRFAGSDVIRVRGGVAGEVSISLSELNNYPKRYRFLELSFTTSGRQPILPDTPHDKSTYQITNVTNNTITINITNNTVQAGDLVGGQALFDTHPNRYYLITANTAYSNDTVTITLSPADLISQNVTTVSRVSLQEAARQIVDVEFFCQSSAVLNWGGLQVEAHPFRTSMIYQEDTIAVRATNSLSYRNSPIANLRSFGIFMELNFWRGDGNLFDLDNLKAWIEQNRLYVQAGSTIVNTLTPLPSKDVKIFMQVSEESSSLSLYVNKILVAQTPLLNFQADQNADMILTSTGVRCIQRILTKDSRLLDGQPTVGGEAGQEVAELFDNPVVIDATAISAHAPLINLNPVTIPAKEVPIARSQILAINSATRLLTVASGTGFVLNTPVTIWRGEYLIVRATVTNISGANITLDTVAGAVIGDTLVYGNVDTPGRASIRFPFDPIDQQVVQAIDTNNKRLTISNSVLSFTKQRAFVITPLYQDKAEILIEQIDTVNRYLYINDVTGIEVGDVIAQPRNEQIIDPQNYFAGILNQMDGVMVSHKYSNGIAIENTNGFPVIVRPYIRIYL